MRGDKAGRARRNIIYFLAAICFSYSSERFYNKIIDNKHFGKNVRNYLDGKGIPFRAKVAAVSLLWISLGISGWLMREDVWLIVLLGSIGLFVTWFILREPNSEDFEED